MGNSYIVFLFLRDTFDWFENIYFFFWAFTVKGDEARMFVISEETELIKNRGPQTKVHKWFWIWKKFLKSNQFIATI